MVLCFGRDFKLYDLVKLLKIMFIDDIQKMIGEFLNDEVEISKLGLKLFGLFVI